MLNFFRLNAEQMTGSYRRSISSNANHIFQNANPVLPADIISWLKKNDNYSKLINRYNQEPEFLKSVGQAVYLFEHYKINRLIKNWCYISIEDFNPLKEIKSLEKKNFFLPMSKLKQREFGYTLKTSYCQIWCTALGDFPV